MTVTAPGIPWEGGEPASRTVSVCITTCNRPALLAEAISSCLRQSVPPAQIVIGDDSSTDETEQLVQQFAQQAGVHFTYQRHVPRLGQNANVNWVFLHATGTHLLLLHDDDVLLPNALQDLLCCWDAHPDLTAAYGKQYVMQHDGVVDTAASERLNAAYARSDSDAGLQQQPWKVGLTQQFPNDGYMILTRAAQETLWRSKEEVGYGGEFDFGLRLGIKYKGFFFLNEYTLKYRLTQGASITHSAGDDASLQAYRLVQQAALPPEAETLRKKRLRDLAPLATRQAARQKKLSEAWNIYKSANFSFRKRFSLGGLKTLLFLFKS